MSTRQKIGKIIIMILFNVLLLEDIEGLTRDEIIKNIQPYLDVEWTCYNSYYDGDGDLIYESNQTYTSEAWSLGKWDLPEEFTYYIESLGWEPVTQAGIDCSGLVSRCWELTRHRNTTYLKNNYPVVSWLSQQKGDIFVRAGYHVMIFEERYWNSSESRYKNKIYESVGSRAYNIFKVRYHEYSDNFIQTNNYVVRGAPVGVEELPANHLNRFTLSLISPNPFWNIAQIKYSIPQENHVNLIVYDISGRKIKTLVSGEKTSGSYTVRWNGRDEDGTLVKNGVYFIKLKTKHFSKTNKLIFLKQ